MVHSRRLDFTRRDWLSRGVIVTILVRTAITLFAPRGTLIVGCLLMSHGSVMVLLGYGVEAYGAFREDVLSGMLYVLVPLYTAYDVVVARWDDLWSWFACSAAGVALVVIGTELLLWNGLGARAARSVSKSAAARSHARHRDTP
jgi:hypothetical protein